MCVEVTAGVSLQDVGTCTCKWSEALNGNQVSSHSLAVLGNTVIDYGPVSYKYTNTPVLHQ